MSVNKSVRAAHCNVQIYTKSFLVATIYQRDGMLRVKDVVHELGLCLLFNKPDDDAALWQPALLPNDGKLIILDQQDISEFPTPSSNETVKYDYVYHSTSGCARQDLHHLGDTCIRTASLPKAQRDARYMAIGKASTDERHHRLPTRTSSLKRRSASSSRTSSPSPTRTEILDVEIPQIVSLSEGRSVMNSFRDDVWKQSGHGCAITREGNLNGSPSPGVEAAHIVPQSHWNVFPMSDEQDIADPNNDTDLIYAWKGTWTPHANGIMLESTLHRCFDARLISIHPETRKIRAFINLGLITKFHGQTATLPDDIPKKVLQHHWDMCCLENTVAPDVPFPLKVLTDVPQLPPRAKFLKASEGDPSKQPSNPGTPSYPDAPPSGTTSSGGKFSSPSSYQAIAHPPSPPASDPGAEERISWPFGEGIIKSPGAAQPLIEDASDHEAHGHSRGRSRQKKRCVATEDNGEHGVKRQRLE